MGEREYASIDDFLFSEGTPGSEGLAKLIFAGSDAYAAISRYWRDPFRIKAQRAALNAAGVPTRVERGDEWWTQHAHMPHLQG